MRSESTPPAKADSGFAGNDRYEIVSRLGAGGMGVVYEALDRQSAQRVALKTLELRDASSIYRFKQEFRGLADISHRNLVSLYELVGEDQHWFFTMELVRGVCLLTHLRGANVDPASDRTERLNELEFATRPAESVGAQAPADIEGLRAAFHQLCQGVHALHMAGKLHRDIKPRNILVDGTGRVVLLDFGLATDLASGDELADAAVMGTVSYMSPEQACQKALGPASDWYSVGVVLYEALTGRLPFSGASLQVLMDKQTRDPLDPRQLVPSLPEDLSSLCLRLLSRESEQRPLEAEILGCFGAQEQGSVTHPGLVASSQGDAFVGRAPELSQLADALSLVIGKAGPQCVLVHGAPGIGKTALVRHFCQTAVREQDAILLEGRCYERESVPFKALDTIVDSLSRHLARFSNAELRALLPAEAQALVRLFPVLRTVRAFAQLKRTSRALDPQEVRRRGLVALREILSKIASSKTLIIRVDDFQWGDTDSAVLLASLLGPPDPPAILWCISYRRDDVETSSALRALLERLGTDVTGDLVSRLAVDRMSEREVDELVRARLAVPRDRGTVPAEELLSRVAIESHGNPFFVEEILRYLQSGSETFLARSSESISLPEVIMARRDRLGASERRLLDVVAVAGAPIPENVALTACYVEEEGMHATSIVSTTTTSVLRAGRLVRSHGSGPRAQLESYHDRIREVIVAATSEVSLRKTYHRLACAYEADDPGDHQTIATFFSRAGDTERAAAYAVKAANLAMESLAFGRAAVFYRMALAHSHREEVQQRLRVALAEALYNAGMGVDAAEAHLEAAKGGTRAIALEQQRLAAESYLRAGHIDQAVATFRQVLEAVGLSFAPTSRRSLVRLLASRATLRLRGLGFQAQDDSKLSAETLLKIDVCGSCAMGFGLNDSIRGAEFQTRHFLLALRAGEPNRVGKAMALEAVYRALEGAAARKTTQELIDRVELVAGDLGNPLVDALLASAQAILHYECGEWRSALEFFDRAAQIYLRECLGHQSAACQAERLAADALFFLGDLKEFATRVPGILRAADDRGDLHGVTDMRTGCPNATWLMRAEVQKARSECERGEKQWSDRAFFLQHYYVALAHMNIDLYEGEGAQALARCDSMWPALKSSFLLRVAVVASQAHFLQGRALVLAAAQAEDGERRSLLRRLHRISGRLDKQGLFAAKPWSQLLAGQASLLEGREDDAKELLGLAHQGFARTDMMLCQQATAGLLGTIVGGSEGKQMRDGMIHWMRGQGVVEPVAFASMMVPLLRPQR